MKKKIINFSINILFSIFIIFAFGVIISGIVQANKGLPPSIFGYSFSTVPTSSMEPTIKPDNSIIFKKIPFDEVLSRIDENDHLNDVANRTNPIIVYKGDRLFIVHRAIRVEDGKIVAKGDNNSSEDVIRITEDNYLGVVTKISSFGLGSVLVNYRNVIFIVISCILSFVLIKQIVKLMKEWIAKEKKYSKEESQEFDKEKFIEEELLRYKKELLEQNKNDQD